MSEDTGKPKEGRESSEDTKRPSHYAYSVRQDKEGNAHYNRIGAAFRHKDAKGFTIDLSATPIDGRVTLRTPLDRLEAKLRGERTGPQDRDQDREA
tara:strand:- start:4236 stop:4523 length:288 start_codon:yes stop_codon:yes gene_type:complete